MSANLPIELPCSITIGDCCFDVEALVQYNRVGTLCAIESVTINGCEVQLSEAQYLELSEELTYLFTE